MISNWMWNLIGCGCETHEDFVELVKRASERTEISVSEIIEPNEEFTDEFIEVGLYEGVLTCFIARGKSGRFYVVEISWMEDC